MSTLPIETRKRILVALGYYTELTEGSSEDAKFWHLMCEGDAVTVYHKSEQAAWESIDIDANFCEREIRPIVNGKPFSERAKFFTALNDIIWKAVGTDEPNKRIAWPEALLYMRPEHIAVAFLAVAQNQTEERS